MAHPHTPHSHGPHRHDHPHAHDHVGGHGHDRRGHHQSHTHGHHHGHSHGDPAHAGRAFVWAIGLNSAFVVIEFVYGFLANSTALMADAGHNLSDVLGLILAWGAIRLARRPPSPRFTYGLRSSSILAAMGNAVLLLLACGAIGWEAIHRLLAPPMVAGATVTWVASVGIAVNGFSAWLFMAGRQTDLNVRGAYLHMVADAAVSLGVVLAGVVMQYSGWYAIDPLLSVLIVVVILWGTWGLLRESTGLALGAVPAHIDLAALADHLRRLPGVSEIHDLHVWALSTTENALTVHLVMPAGYPGDAVVDEIARTLREQFALHHTTLQVEQGTTVHHCGLHEAVSGRAPTCHH